MLKNQFDLFHENQREFERMFVTDYKNDVISEISSMRRDLMDIINDSNQGVQQIRSKMSTVEPLVKELKDTCEATVQRSNRSEIKVDEFFNKLLSIENQKTDVKFFKSEMKDVDEQLDRLSYEFDKMKNGFTQLENYVEKYAPLRVQAQIHESLICCLEGERPRALLRKHDAKVCSELRQVILDDVGNPHLKAEVLDLIEKLQNGNATQAFSVKMIKTGPKEKKAGKSVSFNNPEQDSGEDSNDEESAKSFKSDSEEEVVESPIKRMVAAQQSSNPKLGRGMTVAESDAREFQSIIVRQAKEQIIRETQKSLDEIEVRVFSGFNREKDALLGLFEQFKSKITQDFNDVSSLQIALKDEQDSLDERLKGTQSDLQNLQRVYLGTTKNLARDVITSVEDVQAMTVIVRQLIDHSQCIVATLIEYKPQGEKDQLKSPDPGVSGNKLGSAKLLVSANQTLQQFHQQAQSNEHLQKAIDSLKRCSLMIQKRKWSMSNFNECGESSTTTVEKTLTKKMSSNFNIKSVTHRKFKSSSIYDPMMSAMMEPSLSSHTFTLNNSESQANKRLFSNPDTSYHQNERFSSTNLPNQQIFSATAIQKKNMQKLQMNQSVSMQNEPSLVSLNQFNISVDAVPVNSSHKGLHVAFNLQEPSIQKISVAPFSYTAPTEEEDHVIDPLMTVDNREGETGGDAKPEQPAKIQYHKQVMELPAEHWKYGTSQTHEGISHLSGGSVQSRSLAQNQRRTREIVKQNFNMTMNLDLIATQQNFNTSQFSSGANSAIRGGPFFPGDIGSNLTKPRYFGQQAQNGLNTARLPNQGFQSTVYGGIRGFKQAINLLPDISTMNKQDKAKKEGGSKSINANNLSIDQ